MTSNNKKQGKAKQAVVSTIAIDGPAASGKSTLARLLAAELGFLYLDTGVMYRAVTLAALRAGIDLENESAVDEIAQQLALDVRQPTKDDGRQYDVILAGKDVTWDIRRAEVDANVSLVSSYGGVRQAMTERQRRIGARGQVVMVGRDIGTVVLPDADLKLYLDASVEARARRRFEECRARGETVDYDQILKAMRMRDRIDSTRELAPLKVAEDAVIIDSTYLSIPQVLNKAIEIVDRQENPSGDPSEVRLDE
ncbi:MAG: (d)CMP kinase [Anaerolineales bacterium]|jgi:cytidylate kinase